MSDSRRFAVLRRAGSSVIGAFALSGVLLAAPSAAAEGVSLRATAGLAGQARPGRWAPVRVELTAASGFVAGTLIAEWGDARVIRELSLSPGVPRQLELYIRTIDPRDVVVVRFEVDGTAVASADVPVRVIANDPDAAPVTVCGIRTSDDPALRGLCTVTLEPAAFPRSWRGLSGADQLRLTRDELAALDPAQRRAFELAAAQERLNLVGLGSPSLGQVPSGRRFPSRSAALTGGYVLVLMVALAFSQWRRSAAATLTVLSVGAAAGSAALYASGRVGDASAIVIHHTASLDQYEGASGALLTLRGVAEFPTFDHYSLRADLADGALAAAADADTPAHQFDRSGFPVLAGSRALGSPAEFTFAGASDSPLLQVDRQDRTVRVSNVSGFSLRDCAFSGSFTPARVAVLPPGGSAAATTIETEDDPSFTCTLDGSPATFSEPHHRVVMDGATTIALHLDPGTGHAASATDH